MNFFADRTFRVQDRPSTYVAEENMEIYQPNETEIAAFPIEIGKYFKRWDRDAKMFVSNVLEEYPDN